jgi:U6 snRNA-associated Sm-like protein LSm1
MEYPPPGTALVEELDQKLLVQLRDGRKIIGVLRSFDQFANLVLEHAVERIIVGNQFCDIPLGIYVLRGENLVLMGQVDPAKEVPPGLAAVTEPEIRQAMRAEKEAARLKGSMLARFDFLVGAVAAAVGGLLCSGNHGLPCYSRLDAVRCSAM